MAIEDIPKRRRGLGERLSDILARQSEGTYDVYGETMFGGRGTATKEEVAESIAATVPLLVLPPPEYVNGLKFIAQSSASLRPVKRPDLYPEFYEKAPTESTRVAGMQWIPTLISGSGPINDSSDSDVISGTISQAVSGSVLGDLVVAFARRKTSTEFYVYETVDDTSWKSIQATKSYGKTINSLTSNNPYHKFSSSDEDRYKKLHMTSNEGAPWTDWIFEITSFGREGALNYSSGWTETGEFKKKAGRKSTKEAKELSKKTRAAERARRAEGGSRWNTRSLSSDYQPPERDDY